MDLILWRHAEAIDPAPQQPDLQRALTRRGEKQAARMAAWLDRQLPDSTRVWASPALRTVQTVQCLERKYKTTQALAPQACVADLLDLVQWPLASGCVLVVGHQPTLGQTLSQLLGLQESECSVRKGAVWWLRYRERESGAQTVVVTVQTPELL